MNLLLLIYAMIAGLTGFTAGPSTIARAAAVAETGSLTGLGEATDQVSIAAKAMVSRVIAPVARPTAPLVDARRIAITLPFRPAIVFGRAAPERRLE